MYTVPKYRVTPLVGHHIHSKAKQTTSVFKHSHPTFLDTFWTCKAVREVCNITHNNLNKACWDMTALLKVIYFSRTIQWIWYTVLCRKCPNMLSLTGTVSYRGEKRNLTSVLQSWEVLFSRFSNQQQMQCTNQIKMKLYWNLLTIKIILRL